MHHHTEHRGGCGHRGSFGFIGRHRGGQGFGRLIAGLAEGTGMGARGFGAGRKLAAGDLQLVVLALLAEAPRHGYELIKALEERSSGFYSPSPGMIYPALTYLEELGYATVEAEGAKKLYRITESGKAHLEENKESAEAMLVQLAWIGKRMERMRAAFAEEGDEPSTGTAAELREARHALRAAVRERRGANAEEQRRIAEILKRAAEDIRGK